MIDFFRFDEKSTDFSSFVPRLSLMDRKLILNQPYFFLQQYSITNQQNLIISVFKSILSAITTETIARQKITFHIKLVYFLCRICICNKKYWFPFKIWMLPPSLPGSEGESQVGYQWIAFWKRVKICFLFSRSEAYFLRYLSSPRLLVHPPYNFRASRNWSLWSGNIVTILKMKGVRSSTFICSRVFLQKYRNKNLLKVPDVWRCKRYLLSF